VQSALRRQTMANFRFQPGDVVLFRTGWTKYWITDNTKYNSGEPGIGLEVAKWLSDVVQAGAVGSDTWATEVIPNPDRDVCSARALAPDHAPRIVTRRTWISTSWPRDRVYQFLYMFSPGADRRRHRLARRAARDQIAVNR